MDGVCVCMYVSWRGGGGEKFFYYCDALREGRAAATRIVLMMAGYEAKFYCVV
jgi:hypothetical protein